MLIERENGGTLILAEKDLRPNPDFAGNIQIGHSRLLCRAGDEACANEVMEKFAGGITREQARKDFVRQIGVFEREVQKQVKQPLTQGQFDALVQVAFNGTGKRDFKEAVRLVNEEKFDEAALAILNTDLLSSSLGRRRFAEAALFKTGESLSFRDTLKVKVKPGPNGSVVTTPKGSKAERALQELRDKGR